MRSEAASLKIRTNQLQQVVQMTKLLEALKMADRQRNRVNSSNLIRLWIHNEKSLISNPAHFYIRQPIENKYFIKRHFKMRPTDRGQSTDE